MNELLLLTTVMRLILLGEGHRIPAGFQAKSEYS